MKREEDNEGEIWLESLNNEYEQAQQTPSDSADRPTAIQSLDGPQQDKIHCTDDTMKGETPLQGYPDSGYASSRSDSLRLQPNEDEVLCSIAGSDNANLPDDDIRSVDSDTFDIGSEASLETTPVENEGKEYIAQFLSSDQELGPLFTRALSRMGRGKFTNTVRKLLKPYHRGLLQEAVTEREQLSVRLLRSRRGRLRIGAEVASILDDSPETENKDEHGRDLDRMRRAADLESWLTKVPHVASTAPPINQQFDEDGYFSSEESDLDEELPRPNLAEMEIFFSTSTSFRNLVNEWRKVLLPQSLENIIESIPKDKIWLSNKQNRSFSNRAKSLVEDYTQLEWNWWPLSSRMQSVQHNQTRLFWRCVSAHFFRCGCFRKLNANSRVVLVSGRKSLLKMPNLLSLCYPASRIYHHVGVDVESNEKPYHGEHS